MKVHLGQKYHIIYMYINFDVDSHFVYQSRCHGTEQGQWVIARAEHGHCDRLRNHTSLIFRIVMIVLWFPIVIHDR